MSLIKYNLNDHMVEYDNGEFEVCYCLGNDYLHYIGNGKNIHNPKGNTSCYAMFHNFKGTSLDLSNFNTHNITNMGSMFANCSNLESLNLENFDTHNVTDMSYMFSYCYNLKHLSLSKFNTSNVISMKSMFYNCENLKSLNTSRFNTKKVENMCCMFEYCTSLKILNLSNFKTNNVTKLREMFFNCHELKELDLSSFNIYDGIYLSEFDNMFYGCSSLETLKVSSDCLQFFSDYKKALFEECGNVNIILVSKLDKAIEELFY